LEQIILGIDSNEELFIHSLILANLPVQENLQIWVTFLYLDTQDSESICVSWILCSNELYLLLQHFVTLMILFTIMTNISSVINLYFLQAKFTIKLLACVRYKISLMPVLNVTLQNLQPLLYKQVEFYICSVSSRKSLPQRIITHE